MLKRSIARDLSEFAFGLRYADLPVNVSEAAKRLLFDAVGCAYGASRLRETLVLRDYYVGMGGKPEATVIGFGERLPAAHAAVLNTQMIRALDFNDIYWRTDSCSPSLLIPAAIACGEVVQASMDDVLATIVLGYEVLTRFTECAVPALRDRKWHRSTLTGLVAPLVAARALGLSADQMAHAVAIAVSRAPILGCVGSGRPGMMRMFSEAFAVEDGVCAALLAKRGVTGPEGIFEGKEGLFEALGPRWAEERITQGLGKKWRILDCTMKAWPVEILMHSPLTAMARLIREHRLTADDVESIVVTTLTRTREIMFTPQKFAPDSREAAAQSLPFCIALMVLDGKITPQSFSAERCKDPNITAILQKIQGEESREFDRVFPDKHCARVTVKTRKGSEHVVSVDYPRGDPRAPMTMDDLVVKFASLAQGSLAPEQVQRAHEKIASCERTKASELMDVLIARPQGKKK